MKKTHALEYAIAHSRVGRRSRAGVMPWTLRPHRSRSPRLKKSFGRSRALDGLDLEVARGQVHGYLGPNGSGKTTTIRILLGLIGADGGSVRLLGGDPWTDRVRLHRRLAYVPGEVDLWPPSPGRGHRPAGSAAGRARRPPPRRAPRTLRARPHEEGAFLLQREPAEDRARHRPRLRGRAAAAQRADRGTRPAHGRCLPQLHRGRAARRPHGAAVEPHPRRGRSPVRPRDDHPQRPGRGVRRPLGSSPPDARLGLRRARHRACRARGPPGVHDLLFDGTTVRCHVDPGKLGELLRRVDASGIRTLVSQPPTLEELFLRLYVDGSTEDEGPGSPS